SIAKSVVNPNPPPGGELTYTITVTNHGPSDVTDTMVSDSIPAGTAFARVSSDTLACAGATAGDIACTGSLSATVAATVTLVVKVAASATPGTTVTNRAKVSASPVDPHSADNSATATTTVGARQADLSLTKIGLPPVVAPTEEISYTIVATNNGPSNVTGTVTVSDTIDAATTFQRSSGMTCNPFSGGSITCAVASLAAGATTTLTLTVKVNATTPFDVTVTNTAHVSTAASSATDPNPANDTATAATDIKAPK